MLIFEECRCRAKAGDQPDPDSYRPRFPAQFPAIRRELESVRGATAVGTASVLVANKKNADGPQQAGPFVADALKWSKGVPKGSIFQLVRVAARTDHADKLQEHVKTALAPYKYPSWLEFRSELPKTATGKIQRFKLRAESAR